MLLGGAALIETVDASRLYRRLCVRYFLKGISARMNVAERHIHSSGP
jgi:hypothetical protein